jgi:hypothetical protein
MSIYFQAPYTNILDLPIIDTPDHGERKDERVKKEFGCCSWLN